jgi:DNA-binding CsgD family transcriptional regulator
MSAAIVDITNRDVADVLTSPLALSIWELVRRFTRPCTVDEISVLAHCDPAKAQSTLDLLAAAGLLEKLPIRAERRTTTYRSRHEAIVVSYDPDDAAHLALARHFSDRVLAAGRESIAAFYANEGNRVSKAPLRWRHRSYCSAALKPEHIDELKRMVRQIHDYMISVQAEIRNIDATQPQDCNFQIMIEAVPSDPPTLPMPQLYLVGRDRAKEVAERSASTGMHPLSPRERQVAALLASGQTRPEIAAALGVSLNTVATIGKRIYAKLGVKRRAELASRLRSS